jgi:hypothetical protein
LSLNLSPEQTLKEKFEDTKQCPKDGWLWFGFMVLNATFNNISVISWRSVLLVEETGGPAENH